MIKQETKQETKQEIRHLVRIVNTDLPGNKGLLYSLRGIPGVSVMFANAVCRTANLNANIKIGLLTEKQVEELEKIFKDPSKHGIPEWMLNRRKDPETGETSHLLSSDVKFIKSTDIRRLKKVKTYRGIRHQWALPVRGQRTKSNFRKNKGNVKGVQKKKTVGKV